MFATLIISCLIAAVPAGCTAAESFPEIKTTADTDLSVEYGGTEYTCHMSYISRDTAALSVTAPQSLKGISFRRTDNDDMISLGSLLCKGMGNTALKASVPYKVFDIYDRITEKKPEIIKKVENGCFIFSDDSAAPTYIIETDNEGIPKRIEIKK